MFTLCYDLLFMSKRKFRKNRKSDKKNVIKDLLTRPKHVERKIDLETKENPIQLTEVDRIGCVYKVDKRGTVREITCVSCEILVRQEWITIVYYDSYHNDKLHRHVRVSLENKSDDATTDNVRSRGSQHRLLTWAMRDLTDKYLYYKRNFFKRSKIKAKDIIDIQYS